MYTRGRLAALTVGLLLCAQWPAAARNAFPYHLVRRIALPAAGPVHALLFDPQTRKIYAAQGRRIEVYSLSGARLTAQRQLSGTVSALARNGAGEIVAAVRAPAQLVFLSARTLTVEHRRALHAKPPTALLYDHSTDMLFLESRSSGSIVRVDPRSGQPLGRVRLGGALGQMAANGRGTLYVANTTREALEVIDARVMRDAGSIALHRCRGPSGLAMDTIGRRLFVGCASGRALIVDADLGFTFVRLPITAGSPLRAAFAFHPLGQHGWKGGAFFAGTAAVSAIQMQAFVRYRDHGRLPLPTRCTALALAAPAGELWLALAPAPGGRAVLWVLGAGQSELQ
jgi:hypothetical protein